MNSYGCSRAPHGRAMSCIDMHRQTSNIRRALVCNKPVDHSDVVGAAPVGAALTLIFIFGLTPGFNELGKNHCNTRTRNIQVMTFGASYI